MTTVSIIALFINWKNNRFFHCCMNSSLFELDLVNLWILECNISPLTSTDTSRIKKTGRYISIGVLIAKESCSGTHCLGGYFSLHNIITPMYIQYQTEVIPLPIQNIF
jgi:hypothetical protein